MFRTSIRGAALASALASVCAISGCGVADGATGGGSSGGRAGSPGASNDLTSFDVRIENVSGGASLRTPISAGVWALHLSPGLLFVSGQPDSAMGLEALAEDGDPTELALALAKQSGVDAGSFDTPVGATDPAPLQPGQAFELSVTARPDQLLSIASMFAESNDIVIASGESGIDLFGESGAALPSRDVTSELALWDVGTERDEAPGFGLAQAPRQPSPNHGPAEGVVSRRVEPTRALPIPSALLQVGVSRAGGSYTIGVRNVSITKGVAKTSLSPIFFAMHAQDAPIFRPGDVASPALEALAEDGDPRRLASEKAASAATGSVGSAPFTNGQALSFEVTPTRKLPRLSFAMMFGDSNDVFVSTNPEGVSLLDAEGAPRAPRDVATEIAATLALWDAGTERNEVPGVGASQPPRQAAPDTGPADPVPMVRRYLDATNDLEGSLQGGFVDLQIVRSGAMSFQVTLTNTSATTPFPAILSPVAWALTDGTPRLFEIDEPASPALEALAEDGDAAGLVAELATLPGVGVHDAAGSAPLAAGESVTFAITATSTHRYLQIASMVVPSNDTFLAFQDKGVELVTSTGEVRSDGEIGAEIADLLVAWDAGTEQNQASALGPDMAGPGLQAAPNTGRSEGNAAVRLAANGLWPLPAIEDLVRVTITPRP